MLNKISLIILIPIIIFGCNNTVEIYTKASSDPNIESGDKVFMGLQDVGKVNSVKNKGNSKVYILELNKKLDLRSDAIIEWRYPLVGSKPILYIINRGTMLPLSEYDTLTLNGVPSNEFPKPNIGPAELLRAIADSLERHGIK